MLEVGPHVRDLRPGDYVVATVRRPGNSIYDRIGTYDMTTDETSSRFTPSEITARKGDVIRYTLKVGVHNVNFLPDSNTIKTGLPATSEMLQLPGQTHDILVTMAPGKYYFQCDPHAALGMKGHVEVE